MLFIKTDDIHPASGVAAVAAGSYYTCARTTAGIVCWGGNGSGQLGDGTTKDRLTPVAVSGLTSGIAAVMGSGVAATCKGVASSSTTQRNPARWKIAGTGSTPGGRAILCRPRPLW